MIKYKPIGTIVRINGNKNLYMITGYLKNNLKEPEKYYDYCGCNFPIGFEKENIMLFDDKDIDVVMFIGYQNNDSIEFRKKLEEQLKKDNEEQNKLSIGSVLEIDGKEGVVCFFENYKNKKYANIAFDNNEYKIYRVETDNDEEYLTLETNHDIINELVAKWALETLKEIKEEKNE